MLTKSLLAIHASGGVVGQRTGGLDDFRQKLLVKRGQANRAIQTVCPAAQSIFRVRL